MIYAKVTEKILESPKFRINKFDKMAHTWREVIINDELYYRSWLVITTEMLSALINIALCDFHNHSLNYFIAFKNCILSFHNSSHSFIHEGIIVF